MSIPEYFDRFVRAHFQERHVEQVLDEFIVFASDGEGGSEYTRRTVAALLKSRDSGKPPASLSYFGA